MKNLLQADFSTTTGEQLAARLRGYSPLLVGGQIPRELGQRITAALDHVDRQLARRRALTYVRDTLRHKSNWDLAQQLEAAIKRFELTGYRR